MQTIKNLVSEIFSVNNFFTFTHSKKTINLYILNLIVLINASYAKDDLNNVDCLRSALLQLNYKFAFNHLSFLKRYCIEVYLQKRYNDYYLAEILRYFNNINYIDNISQSKKLIRYIASKLEKKQVERMTIYMNEKSKIKNITFEKI